MVELGGAGCPTIKHFHLTLQFTVQFIHQISWSLIHITLCVKTNEWVQWKKVSQKDIFYVCGRELRPELSLCSISEFF